MLLGIISKDIYILTPGTWECGTLTWQNKLADAIKLKNLREKTVLEHLGGANVVASTGDGIRALKDARKEPSAKECIRPLEAGKGKKMDFFPRS